MPGPEDEREQADDLFEDLDRFFEPVLESDWPTGDEAGGGGEDVEDGRAREVVTPEAGTAGDAEGLGDEWDGLRQELAGIEAPPEVAEASEGEGPPDVAEAATGEATPEAEATTGRRGRRRARRRRGDAEPEAPPVAEPVEEGEEEDEALSVDDLKKAPPQYAGLPGPDDEAASLEPSEPEPSVQEERTEEEEQEGVVTEPAGAGADEVILLDAGGGGEAEAADLQVIEDEETDLWIVEEGTADEATSAVGAEAPGGPPAGRDDLRDDLEEPAPEELEAAVEHFAEGLRRSPEEVEAELLSDLDEAEPASSTLGVEDRMEAQDAGAPGAAAGAEGAGMAGAAAGPTGAGAARPAGVPGGGPAWVEPGLHPPEPEEPGPPPPTAERNLMAAFVTGVVLAAAALALLAMGKGPFAILAGAVILLGQGELYAVMRMRGFQPATALGLVVGGITIAGAYFVGERGALFGVALAMFTAVLWYMAAPAQARRGTVTNAAATVMGVVYVPFLASYAMIILRTAGTTGRNQMLAVVGMTILYDICAYGIGSWWGNRPLAPTISPAKSWEGAIGATLVLLLVAISIVPMVDPFFDPGRAVGLALVVAVFAPLGDLIESAIKRDMRVKDMSSVLPGHGGVLDRIDAILFTAPAAWYFFQITL